MRKLMTRTLMLLLAAFTLSAVSVSAQQDMPLPIDKDVKIGQLPNGMTYYIRHNETPKGQADFYIAQKVGSILEEDNQRGLAHFLEHMCFNGTKNFPGKQIIDWLETVGVKFGANLNAYTSVDETVYNISNVPIARETVQDSCLLILHDWADGLTLDPAEIDAERGVIHEEWRRSNMGQMRILTDLLPTMYPGSRYGYRLPIGTMEVVDNFPYQALRDYYEAWYRPDQQGIVVVGDIDVDRIEGKIKEIFSDIEMPANAPERVYYDVDDTPGTIYAIGSDKEMPYTIAQITFKTDAFPKEMRGNMSYLVQSYLTKMISAMLNNRFQDMMSNPDTPFAQASAYYGNFLLAKTKDGLTVSGVAKDEDIMPVIESVYRELLRAQRGGFTVGEYERARAEYMSRLENAYNDRNNRENDRYVNEYVRHFIDGDAIPSLEDEYQIMQAITAQLPVEIINSALPQLITPDNRVLLVMMPEKEGVKVPTEEEIAAVMSKVDAEDIEAYVDEMKSEPLIPSLPAPGKIVSESYNQQWDATEMILSNGVKVLVKPTKFKDDEIIFDATAVGGNSVIGDDKATDLIFMPIALSQHGLGDYTYSDMQKYLAGKQAYVNFGIDEFSRDIMGQTTPKDLPTLMELIYMNFTNVTITPDEYLALQKMINGIIMNQVNSPEFIFSTDVQKALYSNPRSQMITPEIIMAADRQSILDITHQLTSNAADYLFIFVGNIDLDTFRPLVEQYIATLPADASTATREIKIDPSLMVKDGTGVDTFTAKMETPQTYVNIVLSGALPYTSKNHKLASIAGQILSKRLRETVREEMGATYSIWASGSIGRVPGKNVAIKSQFPMKPEMKEEVLNYIYGEISNMQNDVKPEELSTVVEYMVKNITEDKEKNDTWVNAISACNINGVDTFNGYVEEIQALTVDDVKNFIKEVLANDNYRVVVLDPEN